MEKRMSRKAKMITVAGLLLLFYGMFLSIRLGARDISAEEIFHAFFAYEGTLNDKLVTGVRLPRMLSGVLTGGLLALAGCMMQGVLKNPLAEPSMLGVTQGAAFAVALATAFPAACGAAGKFSMALAGAGISGIVLFLFTLRGKKGSMEKLLLAGTAMSTFFLSLASIVALLTNRSQELAFWVAGGLRQAGWRQVVFLAGIGGICGFWAIALAGKLNIISIGEEAATGLGVAPEKVKIQMLGCLVPICAVCVAAAGNISFIGLFVPHIVRKLIGGDYRILMPVSFLYGSVTLVFADLAARIFFAPYELPVGLFTAAVGVPFFLMLVRKEKN